MRLWLLHERGKPMKKKTEERVTLYTYEDIDNRLSEIHALAVVTRDNAQATIEAIGAYKNDLLTARVKMLREKLGKDE